MSEQVEVDLIDMTDQEIAAMKRNGRGKRVCRECSRVAVRCYQQRRRERELFSFGRAAA